MFIKMVTIKEVRSLQTKSSGQVSITITHCLFCLKHLNENEVNTTGRGDVGKRFFLFLNRYLSACQSSRVPLSKSMELDCNLGFDFPVCGDCFRTVEGFSELYKELKVLELKLDLKIWKLTTIMTYAGRVPARVKALKEYYKENGIPDKIHNVRKRIVKKCSSKLTNGYPRVSLTKSQGCHDSDQMRSKEKHHQLQENLNVVCPTEEELLGAKAPKSKAKISKNNKLSKPRKSGSRASAKILAVESETNNIASNAVVPPPPSSTLGDGNEGIPPPSSTLGLGEENEVIPPPICNPGEDLSKAPVTSEKTLQLLDPVLRISDFHSGDVKLQVETVESDVHEIDTVWDGDDHFEDMEYPTTAETEDSANEGRSSLLEPVENQTSKSDSKVEKASPIRGENSSVPVQAQLQITKPLVLEPTTASSPIDISTIPSTGSPDITTPIPNRKSKSNKVKTRTSCTSNLNANDTSPKKMRSSSRKAQKSGSPNNEKSKAQKHTTDEEQSAYGFRSRYSCEKCSKTFANASSYESHKATHTNEATSNDDIDINVSDEDTSLNEHDTDYASQDIEKKVKFEAQADTSDSDESSFDSESCPETEDEDDGKKKTRKRKRDPRKPLPKIYKKRFPRKGNFSCPLCSETFIHLKTLIIHQLNVHSEKSTKSRQKSSTRFSSLSEQEKEKVARLEIQIIEQKLANENAPVGEVALEKLRLNTYPCEVKNCKQIFSLPEQLEIHSKLHGEFKCTFCDRIESYAPDLALHEMKHAKDNKSSNAEIEVNEPSETTQITTEEASADTTSDINMNEESSEENTTSKENASGKESKKKKKRQFINKPINYNCPRCPFRCIFRQNLYIEHYLEKHLGLQMTQNMCSICKHEFTTHETDTFRRSIESHYKSQHDLTGIDPSKIIRCTNCPAYFLTLQQLDHHSKAVHKDNSRICKDCGKSFSERRELRSHRKTVHKVEFNVKCTKVGCKDMFETELELFYHVKYVHEVTIQSVTCHICKKSILGKGALVNHIKWAHKSPPKQKNKNFVCEQCGKKFRTKEQFEKHGKSHTGPETWEFMCSTCSKKCLTKQKLEEHMRTHTSEKPFVCQFCGVKYAHRHNLRIHVNKKHGDVAKDIPRAFDRTNLTNLSSKEGSRRKKAKRVTSEPSDSDSE